ncbi:MAG: GTP-binding protein, partial [Erysipelotrichaceae bacterium]|nr:GTP-binding protein [Erysipelotrichaceae bacterium]
PHHHHHGEDDYDEDEIFKNLIIRPEYVFTEDELAKALTDVDGDIIRIKGYVNGEKGTLYFNYVLNEYHIYYGEKKEDTLVSVIGTAIDEEKMTEVFHG